MLQHKLVPGVMGEDFGLQLIKIHALNAQEGFRLGGRKVILPHRCTRFPFRRGEIEALHSRGCHDRGIRLQSRKGNRFRQKRQVDPADAFRLFNPDGCPPEGIEHVAVGRAGIKSAQGAFRQEHGHGAPRHLRRGHDLWHQALGAVVTVQVLLDVAHANQVEQGQWRMKMARAASPLDPLTNEATYDSVLP